VAVLLSAVVVAAFNLLLGGSRLSSGSCNRKGQHGSENGEDILELHVEGWFIGCLVSLIL
jgi:hypothetical protein